MKALYGHKFLHLAVCLVLVACSPGGPIPTDVGVSTQALTSIQNLTLIVAGSGRGTIVGLGSGGTLVSCDERIRVCKVAVTDDSITLRVIPVGDSRFVSWGGDCPPADIVLEDISDCVVTKGGATVIAYLRTTTVAAGAFFTCGLKVDGTTRCWGQNDDGQLGDGSQDTPADGTVKTARNASKFVDISAGAYHVCALGFRGQVLCWGKNDRGQLGLNLPDREVPQPTLVEDLPPAIAIAAGGYHTCAVVLNGKVFCWGFNGDGQVDWSRVGQDYDQPTEVYLNRTAKGIAAGAYHSCMVLLDGGGVQCWGNNSADQLGRNLPSDTVVAPIGPVFFADSSQRAVIRITGSVGAGTLASAIQLGGYHTCILDAGGNVNCWGHNADGEISGTSSIPRSYPYPPPNVPLPAKAIAAGGYHTCVIGSDNRIYCLGNDNWAQLGWGAIRHGAQTTTLVSGIPQARTVAAGAFHTCAVVARDDIRCWGANDWGQAGARGGPNNVVATPNQPPF